MASLKREHQNLRGLALYGQSNMKHAILELKQRATRLQAGVRKILGFECTRSNALELVAIEDGFRNWDTLSAIAGTLQDGNENVPNNTLTINCCSLSFKNTTSEKQDWIDLIRSIKRRNVGEVVICGELDAEGKQYLESLVQSGISVTFK